MTNKSILWIGCRDREFTPIAESLRLQMEVDFVDDLSSVIDRSAPELSILAQSLPGMWDVQYVKSLRERWAHTRFLYLLGEWCCGEKRTAREFTEVATVYTHQIQSRVDVARLKSLARRFGETVSEPQIAIPDRSHYESALVAVYSPSKSFQRALTDALTALSLKTIELHFGDRVQTAGVDFVVWDVAAEADVRSEELTRLRRRHANAQIVALVTFPREFEVQDLGKAGVHVVAQPFAIRDLTCFLRGRKEMAVISAA